MDILRLNWEATLHFCEELAMAAKRFKPDMIVGLSRGGLVPARILSDIMEVHDIGILGVAFYKGIGKTGDAPIITQELTMDVKGKRILIVDDVADTGKSLVVAKDYLLKKGAREIKVATLHFKPESEFKPDYYAETTTSWVVYPWESHEMEKELGN